MSPRVAQAFEARLVDVRIEDLLPLKSIPDDIQKSAKYLQIAKSVGEIGLVEPLVVSRSAERPGKYVLLDGHMRHAVLVANAASVVRCVIAADDEPYTYNKRINRLATIQEHFMIVRALERGVPEERLAKVLNLDVRSIKRRRALLTGICSEVVDLLKDRTLNPTTFETLRKMKPMRQIECAELMLTAGNFTASYAKALLAATRQADLVRSDKPKVFAGMTPEQIGRMEREMEKVQRDMKAVESRYGEDVLHLVIASGYVSKLIRNATIKRYLVKNHPEIVNQLQAIIDATSLDQGAAS